GDSAWMGQACSRDSHRENLREPRRSCCQPRRPCPPLKRSLISQGNHPYGAFSTGLKRQTTTAYFFSTVRALIAMHRCLLNWQKPLPARASPSFEAIFLFDKINRRGLRWAPPNWIKLE